MLLFKKILFSILTFQSLRKVTRILKDFLYRLLSDSPNSNILPHMPYLLFPFFFSFFYFFHLPLPHSLSLSLCTHTHTHTHSQVFFFFLNHFKLCLTPKYLRVFFLKSRLFSYQKALFIIQIRKLTLQQYYYLISNFYPVFISVLVMNLSQKKAANQLLHSPVIHCSLESSDLEQLLSLCLS